MILVLLEILTIYPATSPAMLKGSARPKEKGATTVAIVVQGRFFLEKSDNLQKI